MLTDVSLGLAGRACTSVLCSPNDIRLRVVVLKAKRNTTAHEASAQLAFEAAASIRTIASLTHEDDCCRLCSESLEEPLRRSNRYAIYSNSIFVTYYSHLVCSTSQFFIGHKVSALSLH